MLATDFTRDDCQVGAKRRTYATLGREWRCGDCSGRIVIKFGDDLGWHACCGRCGGRDFIHENEMLRQQMERREVLAGLPAELAEQLKGL